MANKFQDKAISSLMSFHYSTGLPIALFHNGKNIFCMPKTIESCAGILNDSSLLPKNNQKEEHIQYYKNHLGEIYLLFNLQVDDYYLQIGPMINAPIESGTLTNLIRKGVIPFHKKTTMQNYFHQCSIANEERIFHIEKITEQFFLNSGETESSMEPGTSVNVSDPSKSFMNQKKEYRQSSFVHTPYSLEQDICRTISSGDTESAKHILVEMNIRPHAKLASTELRSYKNSMICSCSFMTRAAIAGGVNPDDAFTLSDIYINKIENSTSMKELQSFESIMIEGFTERVKEIKQRAYSPTVLNTIYNIDNHLCEDIKIKMLADAVYVNPSYLSELFHKETGQTISHWIRKKRIEEAAHFILNGNESFSEIASFYHFSSQSYFVQCFKQIMGVTPGEYRKNKAADKAKD